MYSPSNQILTNDSQPLLQSVDWFSRTQSAPKTTVFAQTTQARQVDLDRFVIKIGSEWQVWRGPNGGYLAALMLRTLMRRLNDPARQPRVLAVQFARPPLEGSTEIRTRLLRRGRSMTWMTAELLQQGEICLIASAAFSSDWDGVEYQAVEKPVVPDLAAAIGPPREILPPFTANYEYLSTFGVPLVPGQSDAVGGYIRPAQRQPYDAPMLAAITDAWYPATFAHDSSFVMGATLDLTIHFRDHKALHALENEDHVLAVFRSKLAVEGFFEEDGELWSPEGRLLVQSRQLALGKKITG